MSSTVRNLALVVVLASIVGPRPVQGQALADSERSTSLNTPLRVTNPTLLASLQRIWRGSQLWREAVASVRQTGRYVVVATPPDVTLTDRNRSPRVFDRGLLAEAIPLLDEEAQVPTVVVVVNVRLLQDMHDTRLSAPRDIDADLDRILVHEVYGHAVPYLLAGDLSGQCADPKRGESVSDACAISRENAVRAELGLGRRADRGLYSLALARTAH